MGGWALVRELLQRPSNSGLFQTEALAANADQALHAGLLAPLSCAPLVLAWERRVIGLEQRAFDQRTALATPPGVRLPRVRDCVTSKR